MYETGLKENPTHQLRTVDITGLIQLQTLPLRPMPEHIAHGSRYSFFPGWWRSTTTATRRVPTSASPGHSAYGEEGIAGMEKAKNFASRDLKLRRDGWRISK